MIIIIIIIIIVVVIIKIIKKLLHIEYTIKKVNISEYNKLKAVLIYIYT